MQSSNGFRTDGTLREKARGFSLSAPLEQSSSPHSSRGAAE